jgi:MscS family membrane protein
MPPARSQALSETVRIPLSRIAFPQFLTICTLLFPAQHLPAQNSQKATTASNFSRNPSEFLATPRETLKTLYFATVAYDVRPALLDEAISCLDLDASRAGDAAEAARLAIDLEQVLRTLCVPIHTLQETTDQTSVTLVDVDGIRVVLARGSDGLWRFDRATVERIPAMSRLAQARFRESQADRAKLKDDYTDPSSTMRRFLQDTIAQDFYSAARCLDLSAFSSEERSDKGPQLAKQLAFVVQRRGWIFLQEVPNQPLGPPFTWYADRSGRIALERVRLDDGKEAWLFNKKTVRNIASMYEEVKDRPADPRYVRLGVALASGENASGYRRPETVPADLGSPRALMKGFFRIMEEAETRDAKLLDALKFLDLQSVPSEDRTVQGTKIAGKLDAVLRKIRVELSALPDDWNAPMQVLGEDQGVRVELVRLRDGSWRFSQATVNQSSTFFDKLTAQDKSEHERASHLESARDTMSSFLSCMRRDEFEQAAACLDLSAHSIGTQEEIGPILAWKLKFVMDRIGRVYIQEVPDAPEGPRYVFYRGEIGRIVLARQLDGPRKGCWLFTQETVTLIEPMFRSVIHQAVIAGENEALPHPKFMRTPGLWIRVRVPDVLRTPWWKLQMYQWLGLTAAICLSVFLARLLLGQVYRLVAYILHKSGSVLSQSFVAARLRPLTWVTAWWLVFQSISLLDMPVRVIDGLQPFKTFGMAGLIAWLGLHIVDLATAIYMNSELLRPHRSLSDMIVPVSMRTLKGVILLCVAIYVIYQIGDGEYLNRFLTGLGVAGLAASLAAQDALKSFFSTLLLIGERSFKIGDKISVGGLEGTVEQVGFRATRLRTSDGTLLTVPNSTIASAPIDNLTTKSFSRCKATLLVNYDATPERILALRDRIRAWLTSHAKVRGDKVDVSVTRLTEKGVEVALDLYLADPKGEGEKAVKEELNCEVLRLCEELTPRPNAVHHPLAGDGSDDGLLARRGAA